jgi:dynein heavy chain, axonemal
VWRSVLQLAAHCPRYTAVLPVHMAANEAVWRAWCTHETPETATLPLAAVVTEDPASPALDAFYRLLLVRALRPDRTVPAVHAFVLTADSVDYCSSSSSTNSSSSSSDNIESSYTSERYPALGPRFCETALNSVTEELIMDAAAGVPVLLTVANGRDPTETLQQLARARNCVLDCVAVSGTLSTAVLAAAVAAARAAGNWLLLQNAHLLSADAVQLLVNALDSRAAVAHSDFRLIITATPTDSSNSSSSSSSGSALWQSVLVQRSVKAACEPPRGVKHGLLAVYTQHITQERLSRVDSAQWRQLLYTVCFMHAVLQVRLCIAYHSQLLSWCCFCSSIDRTVRLVKSAFALIVKARAVSINNLIEWNLNYSSNVLYQLMCCSTVITVPQLHSN